MFVRPDGSIEGTIGGGGMEADVIETGLDALESDSFTPYHETLVHRKTNVDDREKESGLICAGKQTHVYFVCRPDRDAELIEEIVRRIDADESGLIVIDESGMQLTEETESIDPETPPIRLKEEGELDSEWRYEEQIVNWKRAAVFGGGHVGTAVCRQLTLLGYTVENFDNRAHIFDQRDRDWADHIHILDDYADGGELIRFPAITHAIVVTADQPLDVRALRGLAGLPLPYVGAMGSKAKLHKIKTDLAKEGVPEEWFEKVRAPIGLDMTSNKPAEIAVSIASELLRLRTELFPHSDPPKPERSDD